MNIDNIDNIESTIKPNIIEVTAVTIKRIREKEYPDVYWNIIHVSGHNEGAWGELEDAKSYCNDNGYTYSIDNTPPQSFKDWEKSRK